MKYKYCKTLIIHVTLFSRDQHRVHVRKALFSGFVVSYSIILILEIIGEDFTFASIRSRKITRKLSPRK